MKLQGCESEGCGDSNLWGRVVACLSPAGFTSPQKLNLSDDSRLCPVICHTRKTEWELDGWQFIEPGRLLFQLGCEPVEGGLVTEAPGKHDADGYTGIGPM